MRVLCLVYLVISVMLLERLFMTNYSMGFCCLPTMVISLKTESSILANTTI